MCTLALPTTLPLTPATQPPGNALNPDDNIAEGGRTSGGDSDSGAIAGGVIAVIIALTAVGVALAFFILFCFM